MHYPGWVRFRMICLILLALPGAELAAQQKTQKTEKTVSENAPPVAESRTPDYPEAILRTPLGVVAKSSYGRTAEGPDGQPVDLYTCVVNGLQVQLTNYGAIVVAVHAPDRQGQLANITLGFPDLNGYLLRHPYFGATVGRYCNRIAAGKFRLDGNEYTLATNDGPNHLHGGKTGFDKVLWQARPTKTEDAIGVEFRYRSKDGEEGYPGNLDVTATYLVTAGKELRVEFLATTDKATPVNLTNHCYWNLAGAGTGTILDHEVMLASASYLKVDANLIPIGEADVSRTPFDFRSPRPLSRGIFHTGLTPVGYDHCFVLNNDTGKLAFAARVKDPKSGRVMEIHTTQPAIQLYTGNFLDGDASGAGFKQYEGFCLETQHFPDSPNQAEFPSAILRPGEEYRQVTVHKFLVDPS